MLARLALASPHASRRPQAALARMSSSSSASPDYSTWSRDDLIARLRALELGSPSSTPAAAPPPAPASAAATPSSPAPVADIVAAAVAGAAAAASPAKTPEAAPTLKPKTTLRKARAQPAVVRKQAPDLSHLPLRKVAFKFSYLGAPYSGLAIQHDSPMPTVEGVLLQALEKSGLIDAGKGWEGCGFSRCGRTDRGVSAAGQVVSLWVRSRVEYDADLHAPRLGDDEVADESGYYSPAAAPGTPLRAASPAAPAGGASDDDLEALSGSAPFSQKAKPKPLEFPFVSLLNRLLPPTIRLLAWAPLAPAWAKGSFDARHSCTHRHYKYFFTLSSTPSPFSAAQQPLDLAAMRKAAAYLEGSHDFRNFCKIDGSKQIVSFVRQIDSATITAVPAVTAGALALSPYSHISPGHVEPSGPPAPDPAPTAGSYYVLDLLGRAFLYHQVRHIMAVLFAVGSGLERPEVVLDMFAWPTKPAYEMASDQPLLLWDCGFPEGSVEWQYGPLPDPPARRPANPSASSSAPLAFVQHEHGTHAQEDAHKTALALNAGLATAVQETHLTTLLHAHFLSSFLALHPTVAGSATTTAGAVVPAPPPASSRPASPSRGKRRLFTFTTPLGANDFKIETIPAYIPLSARKRGELPEVANRAWRVRMEAKGRQLKLVGGGKVVRMDAKDQLAGRVMHGVEWVEPDVDGGDE